MPDMSEENYNALLARLESQDKLIEEMNQRIKDVCAMNSALLNTTDNSAPSRLKSGRSKELETKLKGGLRHA